MGMLHSTNIWNKHSQLFSHCKEDLVVIII
ncbi:unnamed protein product, partial [Linum tenue]